MTINDIIREALNIVKNADDTPTPMNQNNKFQKTAKLIPPPVLYPLNGQMGHMRDKEYQHGTGQHLKLGKK